MNVKVMLLQAPCPGPGGGIRRTGRAGGTGCPVPGQCAENTGGRALARQIDLRAVTVTERKASLLGSGGFQPHPPRTGGNLIGSYPWHLGIDEAERMLDPAPP